MFQRCLFVLILMSSSFPLSAAYITDKLLAGVYEKPEVGATPLELLPSGTPVELLKTEGTFTQVRLPNRKEGWIESHLISDEKPAQVMLLELQAVAGDLRRQLQQAGVNSEQNKIAFPGESSLKEELAAAEKQVQELTQQLQDANERLANKQSLLSLPLWVLPAAGLILLFGFISGIIYRNYRLSKRFGGHKL